MITPLAAAVLVLTLVLAAVGLVLALLDRRPGKPLLQGVLLLQLLLIGQAVVATYLLLGGDRPDDQGAFVGYLVVSTLLLPAGLIWSFEEKSRYGTLVLAAVCAVVAVLQVRLQSLWDTVG